MNYTSEAGQEQGALDTGDGSADYDARARGGLSRKDHRTEQQPIKLHGGALGCGLVC